MNAVLTFDAFKQRTSPANVPLGLRLPTPSPAVVSEALDENFIRAVLAWVRMLENGEAIGGLPPKVTLERLTELFRLLPSDMPEVDPYVSNVGSVSFDWDCDPANTLSLFVQQDGRLGYAAFLSGERSYGTVELECWAFRDNVLPLIRRWRATIEGAAR